MTYPGFFPPRKVAESRHDLENSRIGFYHHPGIFSCLYLELAMNFYQNPLNPLAFQAPERAAAQRTPPPPPHCTRHPNLTKNDPPSSATFHTWTSGDFMSLALSLYIYIYTHTHILSVIINICIYLMNIYIYVYVYIWCQPQSNKSI